MTLRTLARRALLSWANWRARKAIHRALPVILELTRKEAEYRRNHKRGSARMVKAKRQAINNALRGA